MLELIEKIFVQPRTLYDQQVEANDTAHRIEKVAQTQSYKTSANKVAAAVQAAGTVDPRIVEVLIKEEVSDQLQQAEKQKKGQ